MTVWTLRSSGFWRAIPVTDSEGRGDELSGTFWHGVGHKPSTSKTGRVDVTNTGFIIRHSWVRTHLSPTWAVQLGLECMFRLWREIHNRIHNWYKGSSISGGQYRIIITVIRQLQWQPHNALLCQHSTILGIRRKEKEKCNNVSRLSRIVQGDEGHWWNPYAF